MRDQGAIDRCPSLGDLVTAFDGGLSLLHKAAMTAHLRQCAACRDRLEQANAFLEASADVAGDEAEASGSSASAGFSARAVRPVSFEDEIGGHYDSDAKSEARSHEFARRLHKQNQDVIHRPATTEWARRWLPAAAVIPLLIAALAFPRMQTVVRAEELLNLASHHERSLPADRVQRLRIRLTPGIPAFAPLAAGGTRPARPRVTPFLAVRDVTGGALRDSGPGGAGTSGEFAALAEVLSRHGFEWRHPMSLAGVRAWRSSPGEKHDEVFVSDGMLVLRTTASEGALREVELTVRRHDYHVVKLALAFEGIGRLEIAEIEESVPGAVTAAASATPIAPIAGAPAGMTSVPVPVARAAAAAASAPSSVMTMAGRVTVSQPALSRWLDRTFGARPERKTFVPDLQRLVTEVRQDLSALDTLARRYPEAEVEQQWSGADRAALRRRVDESYGRISRDLNDLDARIGILFGSTSRSLPVTEAPADWRQRAALALAHAEAMDRQVRHLLTLEDVPSSEARAAGARVGDGASVPSTFATLWDVVHAPAGGPASR